jgi:hypothetical protein
MSKSLLRAVTIILIIVAFSFTTTAQRQSAASSKAPVQEIRHEKFMGFVEAFDEATREVLVQRNRQTMNFSVADNTKIYFDKKAIPLDKLKIGMRATVEYREEGDRLVAESIYLSTPPFC